METAKPGRLGVQETLTHAQERSLKHVMQGSGLCTCGKPLRPLDPKFVLCNAVTQSPSGNLDGCLLILAYCLSCFQLINNVLRSIRGSYKPEELEK